MSDVPTLVYVYGPPAVGKLTVATKLQHRTGFRLFHNHLTVNAIRSVFDFGTDSFNDVIHPEPPHPDDLVIDTSTSSPGEAARLIAAACS